MGNGGLFSSGTLRRRVARLLTLIIVGFVGLGSISGVLVAAMGRRIRRITAETAPQLRSLSSLATADLDVALTVSALEPSGDGPRRERLLNDAARIDASCAELAAVPEHRAAVAAQREVARSVRTQLEGSPGGAQPLRDALRAAGPPTEDAIASEVAQAVTDDRAARQTLALVGVGCVLSVALAALAAARLLKTMLAAIEEFEWTETQRRVEAETLARELDRFASTVAHDLRGPMASLSLSLQLTQRELSPSSSRKALQNGQRSIMRLDRMIEELLRFARSSGRPEPDAHSNVAEALSQLAVELQPRAEAQQARLHVVSSAAVEVAMGPSALRSVIANLIENALKYLGPASTRQVEVDAVANAEMVEIHVADTGQGIPSEKLEDIFRPFQRATGEASGFGLGLATVKRLVEAHGGQVRVESEVHKGSVFTVLLPRAHA